MMSAASRSQSRAASSPSGFTLIEVLAVVLVTALLLGATISFYVNLSREAAHASESTRVVRRASALLDRIANDLEHTVLVKKPAEMDPLQNPWLFLAESRFSQSGAQRASDQIKFIRRELPRASAGPASDLAVVAYTLQRGEEGDRFQLRRWSQPELPDGMEREFPRSDDPDALLLADDLSYFGLRFRDGAGNLLDHWDSTQLVESSELPLAVEIDVALAPPASANAEPATEAEPMHYVREVELPLPPIDLEALLTPKKEKEGEGQQNPADATAAAAAGDGRTVGMCIDLTKFGVNEMASCGLSQSDIATISAAVRNSPDAPFAPYANLAENCPGVLKAECQ
jgi:prepilin-type N-terminal cleavage/methylation domain-containing protein